MSPFEETRNAKAGAKVVEALEKRGFEAYYCATGAEAKERCLSLIGKDDVIAWGGNTTAVEIGLMDEVKSGRYHVIDRDTAKSPEERMELMRKALLCDTYIAGINAMTADGQIINIDGNGNRVAAITFGPRSVILPVSMSKVCGTVEEALARAREIAAPINAQRFDVKTPCKMNGLCGDCLNSTTISNYIQWIRRCNPPKKIKVILIGEKFGF